MTHAYGVETSTGRSTRLDRVLDELVTQVPEIEAASVVSFDGLPMAAALPPGMDEDRVAAMSAALLSLGERAAEGLGRGALSQVYVEGESGTVFLVSADDEAVLVAVAAKGAKVGLMLFEVRRAAEAVADVLRVEAPVDYPDLHPAEALPAEAPAPRHAEPVLQAVPEPVYHPPVEAFEPLATPMQAPAPVPSPSSASWYAAETVLPNGSSGAADTGTWS
jgi:predicted regulator of Ras-like GTPase activity (Roadblock/LC7/MglB family)